VEVSHPGSVVEGKIRREAVRQMMAQGLCELTGEREEKAAWRRFVGPGDVVGVKGCPVGRPASMSQLETLMEVFRGLQLAGVRPQDIVMVERYEEELLEAGYDKILPPKATIGFGAKRYDDRQTDLEGYDPNVFAEFPKVVPGVNASVAANRRSHLSLVVSKRVTKIINVCALKDHSSSGITMALKNMSHGFVNNVCRTHTGPQNNWCDTFIPTIVALPQIREKVVLHIGDGLVGTYDGGPGAWNPHFRTWPYRALFFATDPVAMDRVGWEILDKKRVAMGLPRLAEAGVTRKNPGHESFDRQPEHVLLAAKMGLGEGNLQKIAHRRIRLS
jgi:hypothetical protein